MVFLFRHVVYGSEQIENFGFFIMTTFDLNIHENSSHISLQCRCSQYDRLLLPLSGWYSAHEKTFTKGAQRVRLEPLNIILSFSLYDIQSGLTAKTKT